MNDTHVDCIKHTFGIIRIDADRFAAEFYDRLFDRDPTSRVLFSADPLHQRTKLMTTLERAVGSLPNLGDVTSQLAQLGAFHRTLGVTEDHFDALEDAFLATLRSWVDIGDVSLVTSAWSAFLTELRMRMHYH